MDQMPSLIVAGMNVVGLAFGPAGEMVVATNDAVYTIPLGIHGTLLELAALAFLRVNNCFDSGGCGC